MADSDKSVGVEHDSDGAAHCSGGEVLLESSSNLTVVAVRARDRSPPDSEFCVVFQVLCLINVSNTFALVERCVFSIVEALDPQKSLLLLLGGLASSEPGEDAFHVQPAERVSNGGEPYLTGWVFL